MEQTTAYWQALDELTGTSAVVIDHREGTAHPRFPAINNTGSKE
jgi:hypothetical protein